MCQSRAYLTTAHSCTPLVGRIAVPPGIPAQTCTAIENPPVFSQSLQFISLTKREHGRMAPVLHRLLWLQRHSCPDALRPCRGSFPAPLFPWFPHSSLPAVPIFPTCQAPWCFQALTLLPFCVEHVSPLLIPGWLRLTLEEVASGFLRRHPVQSSYFPGPASFFSRASSHF